VPDAETAIRPGLGLLGLSHIVIEVANPDETAAFYQDVLGLEGGPIDPWPLCGENRILTAGRNQRLILAARADRPDLHDTGVHHAYAVSEGQRDQISAKLDGLGVEVFSYVEDPPEESAAGFYFFDPDGNRVQLITRQGAGKDTLPSFHHTAIQVADILWTENFYTEVLGFEPVHRVGWSTADYARAKAWAEGKEDMAPGARRMDQRYSDIVAKQKMPRVNMQVYLTCGAQVLGIYLANRHIQESPEEQCAGTPRTGFLVTAEGLETAGKRLAGANWRFEGPVRHDPHMPILASIYLRDPGGNFIEFAVPRDGAS
jgi:catechol 2,3-dioxygenase-like lactoylglutathione lyase family enzyme